MWSATNDDEQKPPEIDLYAVLNVNRGVSQTEINERYRALSLLFHPDKQQNPDTKVAAEEEYFKVQKAYQVLSDPFLRKVYDVLGVSGLARKWPENLPSQSQEKIEEELLNIKKNGYLERPFDPEAPLRSQLAVTVDTRTLFKDTLDTPRGTLHLTWPERLKHTRIVADDFKHTFSKRINIKTAVAVESNAFASANGSGFMQYNGTIRHQFSPRFSGKVTAGFKQPFPIVLHGTYRDDYNTFNARATVLPFTSKQPPSALLTYSRRLFQRGPQTGEISLHLHPVPTLSIQYVSPASTSRDIMEATQRGIPSISGLRYFAFDRRFGVIVNDILPKLSAEVGVTILELSTRFKLGFEIGLLGSVMSGGIGWENGDTRVGLDTVISSQEVVTKIEFTIWKQHFSLPMILTTEWNPRIAFCAIVLPSLATTLSYHFIIRPRRRSWRVAQIRAARRSLEEDEDARRKRRAVLDLLKDVASKYTSLESAKGGLVIQEAFYGVTDEKDGAQDLTVDVTTPMQALVRNSQLYIPGGSSKSNLQGFSDPAPFTAKSLRIRYVFRGRSHYAEIPEYLPVVLPLSEHSIGEC